MNPIKLWEYLAMGLPVVSTAIAGLNPVSEFVRLGTSPEEIARAIDDVVAADTPAAREARRSAMTQHTWAARAEFVGQQLSAMFDACGSDRRQA
jgi:glycosyltransferase involved in cell wall biosynthesis